MLLLNQVADSFSRLKIGIRSNLAIKIYYPLYYTIKQIYLQEFFIYFHKIFADVA